MIANNITQEEAAKKSGFIQSNISRMLAGKFAPTLDNLIIMCEAVGLKVELKSKLYKMKDEG
jgi:transcriptional regulator with XRE-family HTH domain